MVNNAFQEPDTGKSKKEKTMEYELLKSKLTDITQRYQEAQKNINLMKAEIEGKECLPLIREVNKYTLIFYDLYEIAMRLMINCNQCKFDRIADNINNTKSIDEKKPNSY